MGEATAGGRQECRELQRGGALGRKRGSGYAAGAGCLGLTDAWATGVRKRSFLLFDLCKEKKGKSQICDFHIIPMSGGEGTDLWGRPAGSGTAADP